MTTFEEDGYVAVDIATVQASAKNYLREHNRRIAKEFKLRIAHHMSQRKGFFGPLHTRKEAISIIVSRCERHAFWTEFEWITSGGAHWKRLAKKMLKACLVSQHQEIYLSLEAADFIAKNMQEPPCAPSSSR